MDEKEELLNAVLERAQQTDGTKKLTCAEAFELAKEFEAEIIEIGHICNRNKIRIRNCQLGCFR